MLINFFWKDKIIFYLIIISSYLLLFLLPLYIFIINYGEINFKVSITLNYIFLLIIIIDIYSFTINYDI